MEFLSVFQSISLMTIFYVLLLLIPIVLVTVSTIKENLASVTRSIFVKIAINFFSRDKIEDRPD